MGKKITTEPGIEVYYERRGDVGGPVYFFVHGLGGDLDAWNFIINGLHADTITFDLRGHGYSSHPRAASAYDKDKLVEDIRAILDAENLTQVVLVAQCYGALIGGLFAAKYPGRVSKLILISASVAPPWYLKPSFMQTIARSVMYVGGLISPSATGPWHSPYPVGKHHKDYEAYGLVRTIYHNSLRSYLYSSREILDNTLDAQFKKITAPTLLIVGANDSIFPPSESRYIQALIVGSTLEVIPNTNHPIVLNNGPLLAQRILSA